MNRLALLFVLVLCGSVSAVGFTAGLQSAWDVKGSNNVYTFGYMHRFDKRDWEYYEGGIVVLPGGRSGVGISEAGNFTKRYRNSAYGFYGGYYYYLMPIFRPGLLLGTVMREDATYASVDGETYYFRSYSDYRVDYYVAFAVHIGMFVFSVSNYGVGGGLNYMF